MGTQNEATKLMAADDRVVPENSAKAVRSPQPRIDAWNAINATL